MIGSSTHKVKSFLFKSKFLTDSVLPKTYVYKISDIGSEKKNSFKIVGKDEADIEKSLIYFKSPMGKSLIGKNKGEMVIVNTPSGEKSFDILDVQYI